MQLRDYQQKGLDEIRRLYRSGVKRVLLHLATGGGKTLCFCTIIKNSAEKGKKALVVVRGTQLIKQASDRLTREGVEHGIMQGANSCRSWLPIQVCSIDTLYRRRTAPEADLIVIDEAHQTSGNGYKWFLEQYQDAYILAVSATPHLKKGMRHVADAVVYPITIQDLIDQGYLCRPRYFAPEKPDLTGVQIVGDDYNEAQLSEVMRKQGLTGKIVQTWKEKAADRITLCFCVSVAHSQMVRDQFREAGIAAEHVDANTPEDERTALYEKLARGEIRVLCNVGVLTTGFDCPPVSCLIIARPTMSYNLHIQIIGRGTRISPGKQDFLVLDHAGNVFKHDRIEREEACQLDPPKRKKGDMREASVRECENCLAVYSARAKECPECGSENPEWEKAQKDITEKAGELKELVVEPWEKELDKLIKFARDRGLKKGWIAHVLRDKFGETQGNQIWQSKIQRLKKWPTRDDPNFKETRTLRWSDLSFWQSEHEKIAASG